MNTIINHSLPKAYAAIEKETQKSGFTMASDTMACSFLRTMAATKPGGSFLELGTGSGLSTSWILDGMDEHSTMISVDYDGELLSIANKFLGNDSRLTLTLADGEEWIKTHPNLEFDFIFADTWHGKYLLLDEVLQMLRPGGLYLVDDMLPQSNWPEGHLEKATNLVKYLERREDLVLTKLNWSSGLIVAAKK
ncbi:putative O-methyltransferase YrrM [Dyadobacter jejuensis]|uniref:Putative O-methyltransferase YrrM n=1 Tax=Dyadobacter jejuensis TaxID=1082580 RepID=A0A316AJX6_9BACT|nr:class I SAM-dependent methyltransferase [Dyadobacter jejuensis]PWJ57911.1 putative O-methyltransferase YrrM [Dyadobacter jejuensis]